MSGQAGPFSRVTTVTPPLKGSFPLDHEGECKLSMLNYMICLHENKVFFRFLLLHQQAFENMA